MAKLKDLLINAQAGDDGVDFVYDHGVVWKVARWGNPRFRQAIQKQILTLPEWQRRKFQAGAVDDKSEDLVRIAFAKTCLLGWTGIEDMPYSEANAVKLCCDPEFDVVYNDLVEFSRNGENYRNAAVEETAGNSSGSSSGSSSGVSGNDDSKS